MAKDVLGRRKKYVRRGKHDEAPPVLALKIVLRPNRQYAVRGFSMMTLRALEEYHRHVHFPRKWRFKEGEETSYLILE